MDLIGNRRKRVKKTIISNSLKDVYSHDLQMYLTPPGDEIQLSEFEELALERLHLLRILEQASQKGFKHFSADWKEWVYSELIKNNLKKFYKLAKSTGTNAPTDLDLQARRADHISHFILRLAHCRAEPLRQWFVIRELEWFKLRYSQLTSKSIEQFLEINNFVYKPISDEEKSKLYEELYDSTSGTYVIDSVDFYKVNCFEVPTLIRNRSVLVKAGFAYIPSYELITCISGMFRSSLNEALAYASKRLPSMDDDRINFLLTNLHQIYKGNDYTIPKNTTNVSIENIDYYARENFPLCMNHIYKILKQEHGLKYTCRLHFGLFIKGIGINFEDAMTFFHDEFTKRIDSGTFEKQYSYWVKYMYGKVGNRTDFTPYSCNAIINSNVGPGEHHGCPFKHWDPTNLKAKLHETKIRDQDIFDIVEMSSKGHYQIACSKCFDSIHDQQNKMIVTHPNQYFAESLKIRGGVSNNDETKSSTRVPQKNTPSSNSITQSEVDLMVNDVNWDDEMKMEEN
ncbi:DNA primase large subunit [Onthophagus taurus]|uniref:DNA primase large subunit n=1 Tax=Onthophagus taurus TaxID=166361 RepID=UPI0039BE4BB6